MTDNIHEYDDDAVVDDQLHRIFGSARLTPQQHRRLRERLRPWMLAAGPPLEPGGVPEVTGFELQHGVSVSLDVVGYRRGWLAGATQVIGATIAFVVIGVALAAFFRGTGTPPDQSPASSPSTVGHVAEATATQPAIATSSPTPGRPLPPVPSITLDPSYGTCGTTTHVTSDGFAPGTRVQIGSGRAGADSIGMSAEPFTVGDDGWLSIEFSMDAYFDCDDGEPNEDPEMVTIYVESVDDRSRQASAIFRLHRTTGAGITLSPSEADCATTVFVNGHGFEPGSQIFVRGYPQGGNASDRAADPVTVGYDGTFVTTLDLSRFTFCGLPRGDGPTTRAFGITASTDRDPGQPGTALDYPEASATLSLVDAVSGPTPTVQLGPTDIWSESGRFVLRVDREDGGLNIIVPAAEESNYYNANSERVRALLADPSRVGQRVPVTITFLRPLVWESYVALRDASGLEPSQVDFVGVKPNGERFGGGLVLMPDDEWAAQVDRIAAEEGGGTWGVMVVTGTVVIGAEGLARLHEDPRVFAVDTVRVEVGQMVEQHGITLPTDWDPLDVSVPSPFWDFDWTVSP